YFNSGGDRITFTTKKIEFDLKLALRLRGLKAELEEIWKNMADAYLLSAEIAFLAHEDFELFRNYDLNVSQHREMDGNPFWLEMLQIRRSRVASTLTKKIAGAADLLTVLIEKNMLNAVPQAALRFINSLPFFIIRLNREGLNEAASHYEEWV